MASHFSGCWTHDAPALGPVQFPALQVQPELPVVGATLSIADTVEPAVPVFTEPLQVTPPTVQVTALPAQFWLQLAPALAAPQAPVASQAKVAEPVFPLVEVTATALPGAAEAAFPEQVRPLAVQLIEPAAHGLETQVDEAPFTQLPFVQVNDALPVRPLLEATADVEPLSAAPTGPSQITPGALVQDTIPPLQGIGESVPEATGTQLGMGVLTDHWVPTGHEKPGLMAGVSEATAWVIAEARTSDAAAAKLKSFDFMVYALPNQNVLNE